MSFYLSMLIVGIGAASGAWLRWGLSLWLNPLFPTLPMGTLASNLIGGFFMGIVMVLIDRNGSFPPEIRLAIVTGFLGGLTTFSTFSGETVSLLARAEYFWGGLLILSHLIGSLSMTALGILTVKWISSYSSS
ncbi:MAG: fluoride efflux transporter CrcB [Nitrospirae bacterium]|nr:fluoride efflux transporter CrcB [Nitrospirota bacterium]MBI3595376.1 fluoride efflux transporter CrcB [Nitrospirota bacterium]